MTKKYSDTSDYYVSKLNHFEKPLILELGVNRGGSTLNFLKHINQFGGKLFSIDINDCSKIVFDKRFQNVNTAKWNFLKSNDINIKYIFKNFPILKNGIDILFIDSYHDETHVKKILETWFFFVKKNGYIFFDDTESMLYRKSKNFALSVNNDAIDKLVYNFYFNNSHQIDYIKYFKGSGISEFKKISEMGTKADFSNKIWQYSLILSKVYLLIKKILYKVKYKLKNN
jgi:cephalosporin hydroxylase